MASKIPNLQVPMNFGLEYLDSPSHGNLKFVLLDEVLLANSAIMSLNSPVIKRLTIELFQTEITVEEFSKTALQCFLEASYSGVLKNISKLNFRDLNKIVHVFEVNWLIERCFEYFRELMESVKKDNFDDQFFLFDEAMYILDKLKSRRFIDLTIKKFTSLATCQDFATNYLNDISSCSTTNLDVIMEMTAKQEHILVEALVNNLERNGCTLDQNCRYILERLNYKPCSSADEHIYQILFEKLEDVDTQSSEDFKVIMRAMQQYNKALKDMKDAISYAALPNLFHDFQHLDDVNDYDEVAAFLINSQLVKNSYIFYDVLYNWKFERGHETDSPVDIVSNDSVEKFAEIMQGIGWKPVESKYIEKKTPTFLGGFTDDVRNNAKLVSDNCCNRIPSTREYTPEELFASNHDIKFKFKQDSRTDCSKEGDCGFMLRITAATGKLDDSFNIQLVTDPSLYPDEIHFHRESLMLVDKIHFTFDVVDGDSSCSDCPVSCLGRPFQDGTERFWSWGAQCFYKNGEATANPGKLLRRSTFHGENVKIRPVVYRFG